MMPPSGPPQWMDALSQKNRVTSVVLLSISILLLATLGFKPVPSTNVVGDLSAREDQSTSSLPITPIDKARGQTVPAGLRNSVDEDLPEVEIPSEEDWSAPAAVIEPGSPGDWDARLAGPAPGSCIKVGDTYYLYYVGADGDRSDDGGPRHRAVGLATSSDGQTWVKHEDNPVIPYSDIQNYNGEEEGAWGVTAYADGSEIILYVADLVRSGGSTVNGDIRLFTSTDGVNFTDQGIVIDHADAPALPGNDEKTPVAVYQDSEGTWHLYYIGKGTDVTSWSLFHATGPARDEFTSAELVQTAPSHNDRYGDGIAILKAGEASIKFAIAMPRDHTHVDILSFTDVDYDSDTLEHSYAFATQGAALYLDRDENKWMIFYGNGTDDVNAIYQRTAPLTYKDDLPVELTSFTVNHSFGAAHLSWRTASETNNAGFYIERQYKTQSWTDIGFIEGAGTTAESRSYQYVDRDLPSGVRTLTYRLRQVDWGGNTAYSEPVTIELGKAERFELGALYPNPIRSAATIRFTTPRAETISLALYDVVGRRVTTLHSGLMRPGEQVRTVDVSDLASGTYFLRLETESNVLTKRFTVVR